MAERSLTEVLRERLATPIKGMNGPATGGELIVDDLITRAAKSNLDVARFIFERVDGLPTARAADGATCAWAGFENDEPPAVMLPGCR
jgi:hypothetical protein